MVGFEVDNPLVVGFPLVRLRLFWSSRTLVQKKSVKFKVCARCTEDDYIQSQIHRNIVPWLVRKS